MKLKKVCNCKNQPCWICFLLFDLHLKDIDRLLKDDYEQVMNEINKMLDEDS